MILRRKILGATQSDLLDESVISQGPRDDNDRKHTPKKIHPRCRWPESPQAIGSGLSH